MIVVVVVVLSSRLMMIMAARFGHKAGASRGHAILVDDIERHDIVTNRRLLVSAYLMKTNFAVGLVNADYPYARQHACQKENHTRQNSLMHLFEIR